MHQHHTPSPFPSPPDPDPNPNPTFPEHQHLNCPRCHSPNTKFCYYNNYNLSQPRHFCKNCRRYWTKGGTLRNIPIGGGTRKITKRPTTASTSSKRITTTPTPPVAVSTPPPPPAAAVSTPPVPVPRKLELEEEAVGGGYGGMGPFGNLLMEGLNFNLVSKGDEDHHHHVLIRNPNADETSGTERGGGGSSSSCWNGGESGWPDLSIFTPGSSFR